MAEKAEAIGRTITRICEINSVSAGYAKGKLAGYEKPGRKYFVQKDGRNQSAMGWRADERVWRADISAHSGQMLYKLWNSLHTGLRMSLSADQMALA